MSPLMNLKAVTKSNQASFWNDVLHTALLTNVVHIVHPMIDYLFLVASIKIAFYCAKNFLHTA